MFIYNIEEFCEELQLDLDEKLKSKIKKYKLCTFHNKEQFKKRKEEVDLSTS